METKVESPHSLDTPQPSPAATRRERVAFTRNGRFSGRCRNTINVEARKGRLLLQPRATAGSRVGATNNLCGGVQGSPSPSELAPVVENVRLRSDGAPLRAAERRSHPSARRTSCSPLAPIRAALHERHQHRCCAPAHRGQSSGSSGSCGGPSRRSRSFAISMKAAYPGAALSLSRAAARCA